MRTRVRRRLQRPPSVGAAAALNAKGMSHSGVILAS